MRVLAVMLFALSSMPAIAGDTTVATAETQHPVADPLVARHLDSLKYRYEVDEDGDYKMTFDMDDKRGQLVYVQWKPC